VANFAKLLLDFPANLFLLKAYAGKDHFSFPVGKNELIFTIIALADYKHSHSYLRD